MKPIVLTMLSNVLGSSMFDSSGSGDESGVLKPGLSSMNSKELLGESPELEDDSLKVMLSISFMLPVDSGREIYMSQHLAEVVQLDETLLTVVM